MSTADEAIRIEVSEVAAPLDTLRAPDAAEWGAVAEATVWLEPTPLERIPSAHVTAHPAHNLLTTWNP